MLHRLAEARVKTETIGRRIRSASHPAPQQHLYALLKKGLDLLGTTHAMYRGERCMVPGRLACMHYAECNGRPKRHPRCRAREIRRYR